MGPKKHSIINSPEKDLLARSPRPAKRRRFNQNLASPQRSNATPAFIQSLIYSPDRGVLQQRPGKRMYRSGHGGSGLPRKGSRAEGSRWSAPQHRTGTGPFPQRARYGRRGRSAHRESKLPNSTSQMGFSPTQQNSSVVGPPNPIPEAHHIENFRGRGV